LLPWRSTSRPLTLSKRLPSLSGRQGPSPPQRFGTEPAGRASDVVGAVGAQTPLFLASHRFRVATLQSTGIFAFRILQSLRTDTSSHESLFQRACKGTRPAQLRDASRRALTPGTNLSCSMYKGGRAPPPQFRLGFRRG
jgi:hypothetical protein